MSIGGAMNSAVSALLAQSQVLSMVSTNLANVDTTGYKDVSANFQTLVTQEATSTYYPSGGVTLTPQQNVTTQGELTSTGTSTNAAIEGDGMFVVSEGLNSSTIGFTRAGTFAKDSQGYLEDNGNYLLGWPTDASGNVATTDVNSTSGLEAVNVNRYSSTASPTTTASLQYNLPADADVGFSETTDIQVYDSLGTTQEIPATWTKTAANTWTLTVGNPVSPTSTSTTTGAVDAGTTSYTVTFNSDGTLASPSTAAITIDSWDDGAAASNITLNLGTANSASGLTQYSSGDTTPSIDVEGSTVNGVPYGTLESTAISSDGIVSATYTNGETIDIYKIPIATFNNYDGLSLGSNNVYSETDASGAYTLHAAGTGGAGTVAGGETEDSTVDTTTQFSEMIQAQQAYSAASQVISTADSMYSTLEQVISRN